jgi:hypothetical protein
VNFTGLYGGQSDMWLREEWKGLRSDRIGSFEDKHHSDAYDRADGSHNLYDLFMTLRIIRILQVNDFLRIVEGFFILFFIGVMIALGTIQAFKYDLVHLLDVIFSS